MPYEPHIWEFDCASMSWITEPLTRRRVLASGASAALGLTLLGALAGCGSSSSSSSSTAGGSSSASSGGKPGAGKTIALSLNGFNTYDRNTAEGCLQALQGTAYKFIGANATFDASKEVANIKQLIARNPDGMVVLAASAEGAARACLPAKQAGIPVVANLWYPVSPSVDAVYYAATRLKPGVGGPLVVDYIVKQGTAQGKILEIVGLFAQPFTIGFKSEIRQALAQHPGLNVVASQQGLYTAQGAVSVLRPMLTAHPDTKVIIDYAAEMGDAIALELRRQGIKDILHITSDGNDRMVPLLSLDGGAYLKADRWYSPAQQGEVAVTILRNKLEKHEDPTTENIGVQGFDVEPGTKNPFVVNTRQELATASNIKGLPPFSYPQYDSQITFGG
jgi:ribose transport system substrate-binding protein